MSVVRILARPEARPGERDQASLRATPIVLGTLWVPETVSPHAAWSYSWMRPPSRSRPYHADTTTFGRRIGSPCGWALAQMWALEVSRDRVAVRLPDVLAWGLRCVGGGGIRGCRRCGRGGAGSEGCGT